MTPTSLQKLLDGRRGRALVLGAGASGRAAHARLAEHGIDCVIADRAAEAGEGWVRDDELSALDGVDVVVKSPGVSREHAMVVAALSRGTPVVGELELGWLLTRASLHAITGSNGKSTVTALAAHAFSMAGLDAAAAGNIGRPLSEVGPTIGADGAVALEASSFQLEDLVDFRCRTATVLNVSPDHLDRHGTLERYRDIKLSLLDRLEPGGIRILGNDDPELREAVARHRREAPESTWLFGLERHDAPGAYRDGEDLVFTDGATARVIAREAELVLDGPHNVANALAVICIACAAGVDDASIATAFRTFTPLAHRLERVGRVGDVLFVNDSKATNLDAMCMAIRSFPGRIVLIAGGRDKASPFESARRLVRERVAHAILIGETASRIRDAWPDVPSTHAGSMDEAVRVAYGHARPDGVVLLAPGCASFDMFRNYEDRGDAFRRAAKTIIREGAAR